MEEVGEDLKQMEIEKVESSRMGDEEAEDVKGFQDGSSSSLVAAPTAGRVESEEGQGLKDNPQVVVAPVLPVDTLLEEVGLKIFGMLSDEDVASCFRVYPKWQQWLMTQRTRFLFPEVISFLLTYLSKNDLLKCREVCSSWRDGLGIAYLAQHSIIDYITYGLANFFDSSNKITSILQDMEFHPGNPFAGSNLYLEWNFTELPEGHDRAENGEFDYFGYFFPLFENFWNNSVIQLPEVYGHHVHFVSAGMRMLNWFEKKSPGELDNWNFPQLLQRMLERLPNLRKFEVYGNLYNGVWIIESKEMEARRMRMRLPQLANLETLVVSGQSDGMIDTILESCCDPNKIKRVAVFSYGRGFAEAVLGFQNLEIMDIGVTIDVLERFRTLERLPPLRKIVLRFVIFIDFVDWRKFEAFQRLSTILEVFASTLKEVELMCTPWRVMGDKLRLKNDQKGFRINLPKLERLSWSVYVGPLDPFIQLSSLKHLDFGFDEILPWKGSAVQLYGFEERMESSNIWTLIPSLKTLAIKGEKDSVKFKKSYNRPMLELNGKGKEKKGKGKKGKGKKGK